ncbi:MAG: S-layer homology domain-containing protein [Coriobacteriia bacterium]|nr:S-layer homology domain-containing protein [Coriobacteriia bacterium]
MRNPSTIYVYSQSVYDALNEKPNVYIYYRILSPDGRTTVVNANPTPTPPPTPSGFPDVAASAWYYSSVYASVEKGLFSGYSNGTFGPDNALTRAQAAVVLWRYFNPNDASSYNASSTRNSTGMRDVAGYTWYTGAANWAVKNNIINGYSNGSFGPDDSITREQLCTIVANAAKAMKGSSISGSTSKLAGMPDNRQVSSWARTSVAWALNNSIISGKSVGSARYVAPADTVTRAEMAAITVNAINGGVL